MSPNAYSRGERARCNENQRSLSEVKTVNTSCQLIFTREYTSLVDQHAILEYFGDRTLDEFVEKNLLIGLPPNAPAQVLFRGAPEEALRTDRGRRYITR
jgi:hypothetical protein